MTEFRSYPRVRHCTPPQFLAHKYGSVEALLDEVLSVIPDTPKPNRANFLQRFPDLDTLFDAERPEIALALGLEKTEALPYIIQLQRRLVWEDPDLIFSRAVAQISTIIPGMPRDLQDLEDSEGRDPIDPLIVAFTDRLLNNSSKRELLKALVIHKCMMKLEDLIGGLHQEVLSRAAGGERVAEPVGVKGEDGKRDKETWHAEHNPYPGADARRGQTEFYQIKNKTGSAKGSDGEKLGRQFQALLERYPNSQGYYVSMIGRTLSGHRSMGAFLKKVPTAEVLVGLPAFQQLGRHRDTPTILMEIYLESFQRALDQNNYMLEEAVDRIEAGWLGKHGEDDPSFAMMRDTILNSDPRAQSSFSFEEYKRDKKLQAADLRIKRKGTKKNINNQD